MYTSMAHYVGKTLHIRPSEILDTWGVPELIVAFGQYANEIATQNYEMWAKQDAKYRGEKPRKRVVWFLGLNEIEDEDG